MHYVRQLPQYVRLLTGLITDRRVGMVDKLLVVGAIMYIIAPIDLIPDFVPFFGEIDDLYLLVMALQRLLTPMVDMTPHHQEAPAQAATVAG